jgi:hypothetical protein
MENIRIGQSEKNVLMILLKNGAKTAYELFEIIEGKSLRHAEGTRFKALYRTIKQLKEKGLIRNKCYFKYEKMFVGYMSHRFWANGSFWVRYNSSGYYMIKTKWHSYGCYWRLGLTSEGKKQLLKRL